MDLYQVGKYWKWLCRVIVFQGFYLLLQDVDISRAFNIDIKDVKVATGESGSYFGYSLVFDESKNSLLVGAPKKMTNINGLNIRSGATHNCALSSTGRLDCSQISHSFPGFFEDVKSVKDEGYGFSISVSDSGDFTVCAPSWQDTDYLKIISFMPGRCVMHSRSGQKSDVHPYFNTKDNVDNYVETEFFHGLAAFGFSTDTAGGSTFVYGAPGLTVFEGVIYIKDFGLNVSSATSKNYKNTMELGTSDGYLGYDVKIGDFGTGDIDVAAGAPNLRKRGNVQLYRWISKQVLYNFQTLEGEEDWAYFGSVLCTADIDQDGIDELLVGAPFYSESESDHFDMGKVYIYRRPGSVQDFKLQLTLQGDQNKGSRFGSAIQKLGDINLDKYPDVVIGAPGENQDTGCIYIYLGGVKGLVAKYSQRICATEMQEKNLKYLGATISTSISQTGSPYPVFAAGSFATDTVIQFNSKVITRPNITIQANPNPIDLNTKCESDHFDQPCVIVEICFSQKMVGVPTKELDLALVIEVDTQRRQGVQRRTRIAPITSTNLQDHLEEIIAQRVDETKDCKKFIIVTIEERIKMDRSTPIEFKVTVQLDNQRLQAAGESEPILDATVRNVFTHLIALDNDCGTDYVCDVDLSVAAGITFSHEEDWKYVVVGHTKEIQVDLAISNSNEPSYATRVTVELSQPIQYIRFQSSTIKQCQLQSSDSGTYSNTVVVCNYYNPVLKDSPMEISMFFDTTDVAMDQRFIKVKASVMPIDTRFSHEGNAGDNTKQMSVRVYIVAEVNLIGSSSPAEITIKKAKRLSLTSQETITKNFTQASDSLDLITLNHKYQMKNLGPSFLPKTDLYLTIPAFLPDATQLLSKVSIQLQLGDQPAVSCTNIVKKIEGGVYEWTTIGPSTTPRTDGPDATGGEGRRETTTEWSPNNRVNKRRKRAAGDDRHDEKTDYSKTYSLTCEATPQYCIIYKCEMEEDIQSGGHVSLNVTMELDKGNIPIPDGFSSFLFQLESLVQHPRHLLFKPWNTETREKPSARTSTTFHIVQSVEEIEIWIIIVSVIAGVVLIIIIAVIFWKLGFFKRNKQSEMEAWRRKSVRATKSPAQKDID